VKRLVFCTGKVYYDLLAKGIPETVAVVRVEELYPWPHERIARLVDQYPAIDEVAWVQEEPKNQGAWSFVAPRLRVSTGNALVIRYYGRPSGRAPPRAIRRTTPRSRRASWAMRCSRRCAARVRAAW
jgi:2-oxoglutarate dehydrogenase E1 component